MARQMRSARPTITVTSNDVTVSHDHPETLHAHQPHLYHPAPWATARTASGIRMNTPAVLPNDGLQARQLWVQGDGADPAAGPRLPGQPRNLAAAGTRTGRRLPDHRLRRTRLRCLGYPAQAPGLSPGETGQRPGSGAQGHQPRAASAPAGPRLGLDPGLGGGHRAAHPAAAGLLHQPFRPLPGPCRPLDARPHQAETPACLGPGRRAAAELLVYRPVPYPAAAGADLAAGAGQGLAAAAVQGRRPAQRGDQHQPARRWHPRGQAVPRQLYPQPVQATPALHPGAGAADRADPRPLRAPAAVRPAAALGTQATAARSKCRALATAGRTAAAGRLDARVPRPYGEPPPRRYTFLTAFHALLAGFIQ